MADPQDDSFLCERCSQLDSRFILSSTPSNPWRPWQVADVVDSATTTGCTFCCLLVSKLRLVGVDSHSCNDTLYEKALSKVQNMKSGSKTVARFLGPKAERIQQERERTQRERCGWITFSVPEEGCDMITWIEIAVTGSKRGNEQWRASFRVAPGPGMPQSPSISGSELPSSFPRGTLVQSTSQSLAELSSIIQSWRQHCHDTHECWKPLSQRRDPRAQYIKLLRGPMVRVDWYDQGEFQTMLGTMSKPKNQQKPLELEQGRLNSVAMPSRCLEIVPDDSDDGQCWFWLRETAGEVGRYIVLSHRWAPHTERVRTLKSNYSARVNGRSDNVPPIAPGDVTNVFQEAAQLTARLGVKYIWIDSLCIVQDDVDDWKREAGEMAKYYENAWLTIAVDSTESLRLPADPELLPPVVHLPYTDDAGQHVAGLSIQPVSHQRLPDLYNKTITDSELLSRGWVFQEWLLSPRIAAFSKNAGVFLVCSGSLPYSALLYTEVKAQAERQGAVDKSYKSALDLSLVQLADVSRSWRRVVEAYSSLNLTQVASDRLIALAGVASEFGSALTSMGRPGHAQYLCGLWYPQMARDLQWERADQSGRPFARVPGFPSWSWASQSRIKAGIKGTDASEIETVGVRWHTRWHYEADDLSTVEVVRRVSVEETGGHPGLEETGALTISLPLYGDFGIENRFLALRIKGRLARNFYLKQDWPGGQDALDRVAELTANRLISPNLAKASTNLPKQKDEVYAEKPWYGIIQPDSDFGPYALGWASFDDINLRVENSESGPCIAGDRRKDIFALRLSRWFYGSRPDTPERAHIYALLFLTKCEARIGDDLCFERVGVGRMIELSLFPSMNDHFNNIKDSTFWLV